MDKYLIAIDLDGTLRHDDGLISDYSKDVIRRLKNSGHIVVAATARPHYYALKVNEESFNSDYIICLSGSEVYDIKNDKYVFEDFIDKEKIKRLYQYATENNISISFNTREGEFITKAKRYDYQILLEDDCVLNKKVKEAFIMDTDADRVVTFFNMMKDMNVVVKSIDCSTPFFIILGDNSNKGIGINQLANYLKINNIISFGNDENDIPMFQNSSVGVAVSNATDDTLMYADEVIESNNDDAVCKYLTKRFIK